jgi:DNA-binding transcriptional LysR family regulator
MDILSIELFMAVARYSSFSIAAEEQNISQSSLSKAIIRMENELEVKLFDRKSHPVKLTRAGEQFNKDLQEVFPELLKAINSAVSFSGIKRISCCVIPTPLIFDISEYIQSFETSNNEISITASKSGNFDSAYNLLQNGNIDLLIAHKPVWDVKDTIDTFLHNDLLCAVLPKNHPLAKRKSVHLEELKNDIWYVNEFIEHIIRDICMVCNTEPGYIRLLDSSIKRSNLIIDISHGKGITFFYQSDITIFNSKIISAPVIKDIPLTPIMMYEKDGSTPSKSCNLFKKFIVDSLSKDDI